MKFKSYFFENHKPIIEIETTYSYNSNSSFSKEKVYIQEEENEEISSIHLISDGILILDTQMYFSTPKTICSEISAESIVMNFVSCNNVVTTIENVESEKFTIENTHNILYTSNFKGTFDIPAFEPINYFTIILSVDYYSNLINEDWDIHQKFSKNIAQKKANYITSKYATFNSEIQWTIHEIKNCKYEGAIKKMYIEAKIKELLILQLDSLISNSKDEIHVNKEDYEKLQEAKVILENNFTNAPTLTELSRIISLNEFKLKKGFKTCFKTTIKAFVTKLRMDYAKDLFKNKNINVAEVAEKCGYKDVSHFSSTFKSFYGFTPVSFRKNYFGLKFSLLYWELMDMISFELFMLEDLLLI